MYLESDDNGDKNEKAEDDLNPQKYESDSEGELKKSYKSNRLFRKNKCFNKKILMNKINGYKEKKRKENKIKKEIILKNKKK